MDLSNIVSLVELARPQTVTIHQSNRDTASTRDFEEDQMNMSCRCHQLEDQVNIECWSDGICAPLNCEQRKH